MFLDKIFLFNGSKQLIPNIPDAAPNLQMSICRKETVIDCKSSRYNRVNITQQILLNCLS